MSYFEPFTKMRFALEQQEWNYPVEVHKIIEESSLRSQLTCRFSPHDPPSFYDRFPQAVFRGAQALSVKLYKDSAFTQLAGGNILTCPRDTSSVFYPYPFLDANITEARDVNEAEVARFDSLYQSQKSIIHAIVDSQRCGPEIPGVTVSMVEMGEYRSYSAVEAATGASLKIFFTNWDEDHMPEEARMVFDAGPLHIESRIAVLPGSRFAGTVFPFLEEFGRVFLPKPECPKPQPPPEEQPHCT